MGEACIRRKQEKCFRKSLIIKYIQVNIGMLWPFFPVFSCFSNSLSKAMKDLLQDQHLLSCSLGKSSEKKIFDGRAYELHDEKTCLWGFQPDPTPTWRMIEISDLLSRAGLYYLLSEYKFKVLISCVVICAFVFAYAKIRFSHDVAHIFHCFFKTTKLW